MLTKAGVKKGSDTFMTINNVCQAASSRAIRVIQSSFRAQTNYLLGHKDTVGPAHSLGYLCTLRKGLCFHFSAEQGQLKTSVGH